MNRKSIYKYSALGAVVVLAGIATWMYLRQISIPVLEPAGPIALQERGVIFFTLALCAIVVIPVFFLLFLFAWKYRADNPESRKDHTPDLDHASPLIEFAWWLVPTAIIAVLSVVLWQSSHALDPYKPLPGNNPMTIDVVALDWKWLFIYPAQGIASVNLLEIPKDVPITFKITADAPMNSFWIPQLGGQIMAMPGMVTQLHLEASKLGTYNGFSANISGEGFAGMTFAVNAVSENDFDTWVESVQQASSTSLSLAAYSALAQPSEYNAPAQYASVDGNLYADIVMKYMMPGGMATTSAINASSSPSSSTTSASSSTTSSMQGMGGMHMP